jgi:hypothetical protein
MRAHASVFDPAWFGLVVDEPASALTDAVLTALGRLADAMPTPARARLRVVLPADAADRDRDRVRWAVPAPQRLAVAPGPAGAAPPLGGEYGRTAEVAR